MSYQTDFIDKIAPVISQYAQEYRYKFPSAIIAQACLESGYGKSVLASKYHNYFGLKCGSAWTGKSVNLATKEEYQAGTLTNIRANFRAFDSMAGGVKGYFDFIQAKRYSNLKDAKTAREYLEYIKADGYATSSGYVKNVYAVIEKYNLFKYDDNFTAFNYADELIETESDRFIRTTACGVIAGKYGNGDERKAKIGRYYDDVQKKVNEMLKNGT